MDKEASEDFDLKILVCKRKHHQPGNEKNLNEFVLKRVMIWFPDEATKMNFSISRIVSREDMLYVTRSREKFRGKWNKKAITSGCADMLKKISQSTKKLSCWSSEYLWPNTWNRCQFVNLRQAFWKSWSWNKTTTMSYTCTTTRSWSHFVLKMDAIGQENGQYQYQISSVLTDQQRQLTIPNIFVFVRVA